MNPSLCSPQLTPVWGPWTIASGAGGKRTWWILRDNTAQRVTSPNGLVYHYNASQAHESTEGRLRRYATHESAQAAADKLNT